jgi:hypothetical protein
MDQDQPKLIICVGGSCRRAKGHRRLLELLRSRPEPSATVGCQGICRGPVVALRRRGELRWYARMGKEGRSALRDVLRGERRAKALRPWEARRRRGTLRHPQRLHWLPGSSSSAQPEEPTP